LRIWKAEEIVFDALNSGRHTFTTICSECGLPAREPSGEEKHLGLSREDVSHAREAPSCPVWRLRTKNDQDYQRAVFGPGFVQFLLERELAKQEPEFLGLHLDVIRQKYPPTEYPAVYGIPS
jgi:hypothetical protein